MTQARRGAYGADAGGARPSEEEPRLYGQSGSSASARFTRREPVVQRPWLDEEDQDDTPVPDLSDLLAPRPVKADVPEFRPESWHPDEWKSEEDLRAEAAAEAARARQARAGRIVYRPPSDQASRHYTASATASGYDEGDFIPDWEKGAQYYQRQARAQARSKWINIIGAGASLALVIGLGVWGFKVSMRNAMGVPILRAAEGPMRIAPEDPGGAVVDHQGLAVNEVAAFGGASAPSQRLVLAPSAIELLAEDAPGIATELPVAVAAGEAVANEPELELQEESPRPKETSAELAAKIVDTGADAAVAAALAEALGDGDDFFAGALENAGVEALDGAANPLEAVLLEAASLQPPLEAEPVAAPVADPAAAPPEEALQISRLRPQPRPAHLGQNTQSAEADGIAVETPAAPEVGINEIALGTKLVQFGAYDSQELALAEWQRLAVRFPELMASKQMVVQSAISGGREFWRLRAMGFSDESDTRRFCAVFDNDGIKCIPVEHR